jgi:putative oxidoreductase
MNANTLTAVSPVSLAKHAARILLGLLFLGASAAYFLKVGPAPGPMSAPVAAFTGGLAAAGYMFPLIKGVELVCALLLLANRFVALALAVLAPVVVNIFLFHVALAPEGIPVAVVALGLLCAVAYAHREA